MKKLIEKGEEYIAKEEERITKGIFSFLNIFAHVIFLGLNDKSIKKEAKIGMKSRENILQER